MTEQRRIRREKQRRQQEEDDRIAAETALRNEQRMMQDSNNFVYDDARIDGDDDDDDEEELEDDYNESIEDRILHRYHDALNNPHWVVRYEKKRSRTGKRHTKARRCKLCKGFTCCYCLQCKHPFCYSIRGHGRECFKEHIKQHVRRSIRVEDQASPVSELVE